MIYAFDVTVSNHGLLQQGVVEHRMLGAQQPWHRVVVAADSLDEAALVAAQMACSGEWMCTGVYYREAEELPRP